MPETPKLKVRSYQTHCGSPLPGMEPGPSPDLVPVGSVPAFFLPLRASRGQRFTAPQGPVLI